MHHISYILNLLLVVDRFVYIIVVSVIYNIVDSVQLL